MAYKIETRKSIKQTSKIPTRSLTKSEQEIFFGIQAKFREKFWDFKTKNFQLQDDYSFSFDATELKEMLSIDRAYFAKTVKDSFSSILALGYIIRTDKKIIGTPVFQKLIFDESSKRLDVKINDAFVEHVLIVKKDFVKITLEQLLAFKSKYTQPVYELIKSKASAENQINCNIEISQLRQLLLVESKYKVFNDFRKRILDPIMKDLESSDLKIKMEKLTAGRKVYALNFKGRVAVEETDQMRLDI